ncbi:hypothetical protein B0H14DRAFT_2424755, partial [Mycena olivaceomarginata]
RSMRSMICCMAASEHGKPHPNRRIREIHTCSKSTSSLNFMWIQRISRRPVGLGIPMSTSRSNRPNGRRAGPMELGRLVAVMKTTFERALSPSTRVESYEHGA